MKNMQQVIEGLAEDVSEITKGDEVEMVMTMTALACSILTTPVQLVREKRGKPAAIVLMNLMYEKLGEAMSRAMGEKLEMSFMFKETGEKLK